MLYMFELMIMHNRDYLSGKIYVINKKYIKNTLRLTLNHSKSYCIFSRDQEPLSTMLFPASHYIFSETRITI